MSDQTLHNSTANPMGGTQVRSTRRTGWVGWIFFAGTLLILLGVFNLIEGLVALFNDDYYVPTAQGLLVFDLTGWGWIHLVTGVLAIAIGVGLFSGAMWARVCGVILVGLNAIAQLAFLSAYPLWAVIVIALDVLVIWALVVHGAEAKSTEDW
jgi:hypothetical protein